MTCPTIMSYVDIKKLIATTDSSRSTVNIELCWGTKIHRRVPKIIMKMGTHGVPKIL